MINSLNITNLVYFYASNKRLDPLSVTTIQQRNA